MVVPTQQRNLVLKTQFMPHSKHYLSRHEGFTLIEALVAITILLLGVLGPLSTATRGITDGLIAKNKIVALGLAQEGIDLVRVKIKNNLSYGNRSEWLAGLDTSPADCLNNTCSVLVLSNEYSECAGTDCDLSYSNDEGVYAVATSGGVGPIFNRTIQIKKLDDMGPNFDVDNGDYGVEVTVIVGWSDKNQSQSVTLRSYLYNNILI